MLCFQIGVPTIWEFELVIAVWGTNKGHQLVRHVSSLHTGACTFIKRFTPNYLELSYCNVCV